MSIGQDDWAADASNGPKPPSELHEETNRKYVTAEIKTVRRISGYIRTRKDSWFAQNKDTYIRSHGI